MLRRRAALLAFVASASFVGTAEANPVPPGWVAQPCVVVDAAPLVIDAVTGVATTTVGPGTMSGEWMRIYCPPGVTLGVPGPAGPTGAQGTQGTQGTPGSVGVSGVSVTVAAPIEPALKAEIARIRRELRRARARSRRWERAARAARNARPAPESPIVLG